MLVCGSFAQFCTRDRGCSAHPAFPAPSFWGERFQRLGRFASREREDVFEMKMCSRWSPVITSISKQSILSSPREMYIIDSQDMSGNIHLRLEDVVASTVVS